MFDIVWQHWFLLLLVAVGLVGLWIAAVLSKYVRLMLNIIRDTPGPPLMGQLDFAPIEGRRVTFRAFDGTRLEGMFLSHTSLAGAGNGPPSAITNNGCPSDGGGALPSTDADSGLPSADADPHNAPTNNKGPAEALYGLRPDSRGVIVFCHEYGSDQYSCARYCRSLLQAGFDVFTFDFRSHGRSGHLVGYEPRLWCTDREVSDCLGALALVQSEIEDRQLDLNIGLFGISRGGGAAIMAAAESCSPTSVKAVLTDSSFSTDSTLEWSMRKWVHVFARVRFVYENHRPFFWRFLRWLLLKFARVRFNCRFMSVRKSLKRLNHLPVFFIHGEKDSYICSEQTRTLFSLASRPRYLWIVPRAKHNQSVATEPDRYGALTLGFFEKYLATTPPEESRIAACYRNEIDRFFARDDNSSSLPLADKDQRHVATTDRLLCRPQRGGQAQAIREETATLPAGTGRAVAQDSTNQS